MTRTGPSEGTGRPVGRSEGGAAVSGAAVSGVG
jgi:hypothetical protein